MPDHAPQTPHHGKEATATDGLHRPENLVITIDGPSGAGKSTISRELARRLGGTFLDTGAMYRAVGLAVQRAGIDPGDEPAVAGLLADLSLTLEPAGDDTRVLLNGEDVSRAIRTAEMGMMASRVSALPAVRRFLTGMQRQTASQGCWVAEGRDMGTVVFPDAACKFYLDADPKERARRRAAQLAEQGETVDVATIQAQIEQRDRDDAGRALAPLRPAPDAIHIDSSNLTIDQVVATMLQAVAARVGHRKETTIGGG